MIEGVLILAALFVVFMLYVCAAMAGIQSNWEREYGGEDEGA